MSHTCTYQLYYMARFSRIVFILLFCLQFAHLITTERQKTSHNNSEKMLQKKWKMNLLTSELARQFCGSSRFLRRLRGANSVCGESCGGGGIADGSCIN